MTKDLKKTISVRCSDHGKCNDCKRNLYSHSALSQFGMLLFVAGLLAFPMLLAAAFGEDDNQWCFRDTFANGSNSGGYAAQRTIVDCDSLTFGN